MTADVIAKNLNVKIEYAKFNALTATVNIGEEKTLLMKPQTYMNLSGQSVRQAIKHYKLPQKNILVVSDEVLLPPGKIRIRRSGSAGGHNGLKDIIEKCGGEDFPRIRIGVGAPPHADYDMADWVLSKMTTEDKTLIAEAATFAATAVGMIVSGNIDEAMCKYN